MVQAVVSWDARLVEQVLGKRQRAINKAFSSWAPPQEVVSFQAKSLCPILCLYSAFGFGMIIHPFPFLVVGIESWS